MSLPRKPRPLPPMIIAAIAWACTAAALALIFGAGDPAPVTWP